MKLTRRLQAFLWILLFSLFLTATATAAPKEGFVVLYTTDMHGRIFTDDEAIGLDVIAAIKKTYPNSILLDAGDFLHGKPAATLTQGRDVTALMKRTGYTAAAVGNHEFNYGLDALLKRAEAAATPPHAMKMLSANIRREEGGEPFAPWTIEEVGGVRVGIFGLTTPETAIQADPAAVKGLVFGDARLSAKAAVRRLREAGCQVVIALTHVETSESRLIARDVRGIDIIIGGHSHVQADESINGTALVAAGEHGKLLGVLEVTPDERGVFEMRNRFLTRHDTMDVAPDLFLSLCMGMIRDEQDALLSRVVGRTEVDLIGDKATIRTQETNLGRFVADAVRSATGSDIAIMNAGTIRDTIARGDITRGDILTVFPFGNTALSKKVTGAQLRGILENAFGRYPELDGRFPQVSGLAIEVNPANEPGHRIVSLSMTDGTPIDDGTSYTLGTNDFMASGGDDFPYLRDLPVERQSMNVDEAFLLFLEQNGTTGYTGSEPPRVRFR